MDAKLKSLQEMLPLRVTQLGFDAEIWYADGDQCAVVYGNLGAMPEPIEALDVAQRMADALNALRA